MKEKKGNIKYTAEDIRNYLAGQLSHQEMQALEKAALEDPFLADAIEGYEESLHHPVSFESDLQLLNSRLRDRIDPQNKKSRLILWSSSWKVAASLLLVIGSSVLLLTVLHKKETRNTTADTIKKDSGLAVQETQPTAVTADSNGLANTARELKSKTRTDSLSIAYVAPEKEKKSSLKITQRLNKPVADKPIAEFSTARPSAMAFDTVSGNRIASLVTKKGNHTFPPLPIMKQDTMVDQVAGIPVLSNQPSTPIYIQGLVVDEVGKPLPSAIVQLKGSNRGTLTDSIGYFKLYPGKANSNKELVIRRSNFQTISMGFHSDSSIVQTFKLLPNLDSLNEVVVTGYASQRKKDITGSITEIKVKDFDKPEGWDSLNNYINANKHIQTADSLLKGKEVISFLLDNHGRLSDFKVLQSVSPAHDAKIIELIHSGPPLKIKKRISLECEITVLFN